MQKGMSAMGQKQTLPVLLDHLVGAGEKPRWNGEAERLGGPEVDYQLKCCWPLDREFSRAPPLQHFTAHNTGLPKHVEQIYPVSQQASRASKVREERNGRQLVTKSEIGEYLNIC